MSDEPTRMMPSAEQTLLAAPTADPMRTQMGGTTECPVCHTTTPLIEGFCTECGFLLSSPVPPDVEIPLEQAPPAELVELETGRRHRLKEGENTVGRQNADVLLQDSTVSRAHARIRLENGQVLVEDLGSTNGTKVGDQRLTAHQPVAAPNNTLLRFGNLQMRLEIHAASTPEKTVVVEAPPSEKTVVMPTAPLDKTIVIEEKTIALGATAQGTSSVKEATPLPGEPVAVAWLKKVAGSGPEQLPIPSGTSSLGRRAENSLVLAGDPYVSGRHAEIKVENQEAFIIDVGSTNGTLVNGHRLAPNQLQTLQEGDQVQIGHTLYRFEWANLQEA